MSRILWIPRGTDDYRELLGFRLGMALAFLTIHSLLFLLFAWSSETKVKEYASMIVTLSCIFLATAFIIDLLIIRSNVFAFPSILIVYEDKVFLQNPDEFGWRVIPREKFKVKIISYKPAGKPTDPPKNLLKIILEEPYKGRIYYRFSYDLFKKERTGEIKVTDAYLRKLINLLKPKRVMDLGVRIAAGYAAVLANYSGDEEIIELAEKALEYDFTERAVEIARNLSLLGCRIYPVDVLYAVEYSLVAITFFGSRDEVKRFLGMIIDESFVDYVYFLGPKFIKKWIPYTHREKIHENLATFAGVLSLILYAVGGFLSPDYWGYLFGVLLWSWVVYGLHWLGFRGTPFTSDLRDFYFRGCKLAFFFWLFFAVFHAFLPFIAWLITGFFQIVFIIVYLIISLIMSYGAYLWLIDDLRIHYYEKIYEAWCKFLSKYEKLR